MKTSFYCVLMGEDFNPQYLLEIDKFKIKNYNFKGDLAKKGPSKGQPMSNGYICLLPKENNNLDTFVSDLYEIKDLIIENKADFRVIYFNLAYETQCNWEFEPSTLSMLGELDLTLGITCYKA